MAKRIVMLVGADQTVEVLETDVEATKILYRARGYTDRNGKGFAIERAYRIHYAEDDHGNASWVGVETSARDPR